jgi:putative ABC transport system permease protein
LRRSPGTTLLSLATLALGLAAVTAIFSFINSVLLRPLPYPDADRILALSEERGRVSGGFTQISAEAVAAVRAGSRTFERVGAFRERQSAWVERDMASPVTITEVDTELVELIGVQPQRGRLFERAEVTGLAPLALISDALWRSRLGAREDVLGLSIRLGDQSYTVVGVMPPGFRFYERSDVWIPLVPPRAGEAIPAERDLSALAKLRHNASLEDARREVGAIGRIYAAEGGEAGAGANTGNERGRDEGGRSGARLVVRDGMVDRGSEALTPFILLLLGAAAVVLLVTCSNVASLLLARAVARRGEMAVRTALGASRGVLLRQLLLESLLLALGAALLGLGLSYWGIRLVAGLVPLENLPAWVEIGIDFRVFGFALGVSLLSIVGVGTWPALELMRINLAGVLKSSSEQGVTRGARSRPGRIAVGAELASATILLIAVALLGRTYLKMAFVDLGYEPERVALATLRLDPARYPTAHEQVAIHRKLIDSLQARKVVAGSAFQGEYTGLVMEREVGGAEGAPGAGRERFGIFRAEDRTHPVSALLPFPRAHVVSDEYFRTLGLRLVAGRGFGPDDQAGAPVVAVISERLARHLWASSEPLGRAIALRQGGPPITVVGVAADVREARSHRRGLAVEALPDLYLSERQADAGSHVVLLRPRGTLERGAGPDAAVLASTRRALEEAIRSVDPAQPLLRIVPMVEQARAGTLLLKPVGALMTTFALIALVLATIGIYGVISYSVARRTREIGIRLALGAPPSAAVHLVLSGAWPVIASGIGAGLIGAAFVSAAIRPLLWDLSPLDLLTYGAVATALSGVGLVACLVPARRAARIPAALALRQE